MSPIRYTPHEAWYQRFALLPRRIEGRFIWLRDYYSYEVETGGEFSNGSRVERRSLIQPESWLIGSGGLGGSRKEPSIDLKKSDYRTLRIVK